MQRIRELRAKRGLTQVRLAVAADMNPATLNRIEQGKANPNIKTLERLAEALGVSLYELLEDDSKKAQASLWSDESPERRSEVADRFLKFGGRLVEHWGHELESRIEAEDEEWLQSVADMWEEYTAILSMIGAHGTPNPGESLGRIMDINGFGHRLVEMVQEHNERCREEGAEDSVLKTDRLVGKGAQP